MKIIRLEETDSTNEYAKRNFSGKNAIIVAKRQTAGKGTHGRSFISDDGGIYLTVVKSYKNFPSSDAFSIMVSSCVAVCKTLEYYGIKPTIRWANDVLCGGKKICGTLIENYHSSGHIRGSIVGMGLNVNNEIPQDLSDIAISMKECAGKEFEIEKVLKVFLKNLKKRYTVEEYKSYINWFNRPVTVKTGEEERTVTALNITDDGRLLADDNGKIIKISAAEVSLRL